MNSMQIRCFLNAAQCLNFTFAASKLYVTQSTLSKNIAALEQELGVQLFIRDYRNTQLTPGGEILYRGLSEAAEQIGRLTQAAHSVIGGNSGNAMQRICGLRQAIWSSLRADTPRPNSIQRTMVSKSGASRIFGSKPA